MTPQAQALLDVWFGDLDAEGRPSPEHVARWFDPPAGFDESLARRFGGQVEEALVGGLGAWADEPRGRLALVLLLDQLPRNLHRGTGRAFAGDARALALVLSALESGDDRALWPIERSVFYLPLMHAEDLAVQDRSVLLYAKLRAEPAPASVAGQISNAHAYALTHRDAIRLFGRFPGRNQALGRTSTPEERAFLARHPSGFAPGAPA